MSSPAPIIFRKNSKNHLVTIFCRKNYESLFSDSFCVGWDSPLAGVVLIEYQGRALSAWAAVPGGPLISPERLRAYRRHSGWCKQKQPPKKLLVFKAKVGNKKARMKQALYGSWSETLHPQTFASGEWLTFVVRLVSWRVDLAGVSWVKTVQLGRVFGSGFGLVECFETFGNPSLEVVRRDDWLRFHGALMGVPMLYQCVTAQARC